MPTDDELIEQVIFLDAKDEVASIRAKLTTVRGNQAAIVVPLENRSLRSPVAVRLIARMAEDMAMDLAVVTGDVTLRRLASDEGLLVFRTVNAYRDYVRRQSAALGKIGAILYDLRTRADRTFGVILLFVLATVGGGMAYVVVPEATVTLEPVSEQVSDIIVVKADPSVKKVDYEGRQIPTRVVYVPLESSVQVPSSGKKQMPNARAEGQVTFTNRTGEAVTVPAGTVVRTADNVRFTTTAEVTINAGQGSTVRTEIIAVEPGARGNVDRGRISKVEGALDSRVTVFNEGPTFGGGAREVEVVTASDRERARTALMDVLNKEAQTKLESQRKPEERLSSQSINFTILEEVYDKKEGEQGKTLNLRMTARAAGTLLSDEDISDLVTHVWQPKTRPGYYVPAGAHVIHPPEVLKIDGEVMSLVIRVEGVAVARISEDLVRENVRWKTVDEARSYLTQSLSLAKEPGIEMKPNWAARALRINVVIEGPWKKSTGADRGGL